MLVVLVASAGCGILPSETVCSTIALFGIRAEIRDSASGAPAAQNAVLIARDGAYVDSATTDVPGAAGLSAVVERAGTYDVVVRKSGYADWRQLDVTVTHDQCHVRPVDLKVLLQPS